MRIDRLPDLRRLAARALAICAGLTACAVPASAWAQQGAQPWPTTQFVMVPHAPNDKPLFSLGDQADKFSPADMAVIIALETHLGRVAEQYERMGFPPPKLPIRAGRKGGKAFLAHFHDYDDARPPARAGYNSNEEFSMEVDSSRAIVKGAVNPRVYDDLAHELFHNIQHAIHHTHNGARAFNLDRGGWIMEGMAEAVGTDTSEALGAVHKSSDDAYRLGMRAYNRPLQTRNKSAEYATMSFWRYLAEVHAAARSNARPTSVSIVPDYSYLVQVLANPFRGPVSPQADLAWLDTGLRNATGQGLARHYANFAAAYADYVPQRLGKTSMTPAAARTLWLDKVFSDCPARELTLDQPDTTYILRIDRNAARCVQVRVDGDGNASLTLQVRASDPESLRTIHVGTDGGQRVGQLLIAPAPTGGGYIGSIDFEVAAGQAQVFIISNIAHTPATTMDVVTPVHLMASGWTSSLTSPQAAPPSQSPRPAPGQAAPRQGAPGGPGSAANNGAAPGLAAPGQVSAEIVRTGVQSQSNRSALGAAVGSDYKGAKCNNVLLRPPRCGPTTTINLMLTSGSIGDMSQTTSQGGAFGQFMGQLGAIAMGGVSNVTEELYANEARIAAAEGSRLTMTFPAIDYGFTGSFDNVRMTVNASRNSVYEALGPDIVPGPGRLFPDIGRVTIDEYTPLIMRGSFSAQLTDTSRFELSLDDEDPVPPAHRTISGRFTIAAPWRHDNRVTPLAPAESQEDAVLQDMVAAFPALGGLDLKALVPADATRGRASSKDVRFNGPIGRFPACDCDCRELTDHEPPCRPICEVRLRQCQADEQQREALAKAQRDRAALADGVKRQATDTGPMTREQYIQGLRDVGASDEEVERLLGIRDRLMKRERSRPQR